MSSESLIITGGESQPARFNQRTAAPFVDKSISAETRRLYHRVIREFFTFVRLKHESGVTPDDVLRWRDALMRKGQKASTVSLKLSVVRSFFEYLRAYGLIPLNPASTRLVPPPPVPEGPAGRALVAKEARYLFASPDRSRPAGARDYAIILIMSRMSLRVSEVASLKASSITWSHGRSILKFKVKGGRERTLPLPSGHKNCHRRLPETRPAAAKDFEHCRTGRLAFSTAYQLAHTRLRQAALDALDRKDHQEVCRLRRDRRPFSARPEEDRHHPRPRPG